MGRLPYDSTEKPNEVELRISKHAYDRAKERMSWTKSVLDKMAMKAFTKGITHSQSKSKLNDWISMVWKRNKTCNNIRIYGEDVYFFAGTTLITIYRLPTGLLRYIKISKEKKKK